MCEMSVRCKYCYLTVHFSFSKSLAEVAAFKSHFVVIFGYLLKTLSLTFNTYQFCTQFFSFLFYLKRFSLELYLVKMSAKIKSVTLFSSSSLVFSSSLILCILFLISNISCNVIPSNLFDASFCNGFATVDKIRGSHEFISGDFLLIQGLTNYGKLFCL